MERGETKPAARRRSRCRLIIIVSVVILVTVFSVVLGVTLRQSTDQSNSTSTSEKLIHDTSVKTTFISRCEKFKEYDCQKIWGAFEQAYVGRDPCKVPMEAYDPFVAAAHFKPACNRMMFWSKTRDVVHDFTEKRDCFLTLEDTLLGSVVNDLTWCGKEGSSETFTTGCPGWTKCENNPVRSFWNRASAAFAEVACGDVTVMLNGSIATPFSPESIFASIEVKKFNPSSMKRLNVVLVTQKKPVTNCKNTSLKDLQEELKSGIQYNCKEVSEDLIQKCASDSKTSCGACW